MDTNTDTAAVAPLEDVIPDSLKITLRKPITIGADTVTAIDLREPTGAEWLLWDKLTGVEANIVAISTVAAVRPEVVRQMGVRDINQATAYLDRFF